MREQLQILVDRTEEKPQIEITYFQPDGKKNGGAYATVTGIVKKIDLYKRFLHIMGGTVIPIDDIINMDGEIFGKIIPIE